MSSFHHRYYRVPRSRIVLLRYLLEGYDGLIFLRTLEKEQALVEVAFHLTCREEAESILTALADELSLEEVFLRPEDIPPL